VCACPVTVEYGNLLCQVEVLYVTIMDWLQFEFGKEESILMKIANARSH
jgi:hypothetical protein